MFTRQAQSSSLHPASSHRAPRRSILLAVTLIMLSALALSWHQRQASAARLLRSDHQAANLSSSGASITISTIAGGGFSSNIPVKQAPMNLPSGVALDPQGRGFYVLDESDSASLLRFVNTTDINVTIAGTTIFSHHINLIAGGGLKTDDGVEIRSADLAMVTGLVVDPSGNAIYLCAPLSGGIRLINIGPQNFTAFGKTVAPGTITTIFVPSTTEFHGLAMHPTTRELYFIGDGAVYRLDANGQQTRFAGGGSPSSGNGDGGPALNARLTAPFSLAFDSQGNLLIADGGDVRTQTPSGSVRKVLASNKTISSLVTGLLYPTGITVGPGDNAYVAVSNAQQIARVSSTGSKTVVAGDNNGQVCDMLSKPNCGDGGAAGNANLSLPGSNDGRALILAADANGFYLPDFRYQHVRYVNLSASNVTILESTIGAQKIDSIVGNGVPPPYDGTPATAAELITPTGVAADGQGNFFIADASQKRIRFINRGSSPATLFAGTVSAQTVPPGQIITINKDVGARVDESIGAVEFRAPQGLALTAKGLYIVDSLGGAPPNPKVIGKKSGLIRFVNTTSSNVTLFPNSSSPIVVPPGIIKTVAGIVTSPSDPNNIGDNGLATSAILYPTDLAADEAGDLFIADQGNNRIRKVDGATGIITTIYGNGSATLLNSAAGVTLDNQGRLLVADTRNNRVLRQETAGGTVFNVIADSSLGIGLPRGVTTDSSGKIYLTNTATHQVLQLIAPDSGLGAVSLIAGIGEAGFSGDNGDADQARLNLPTPGTGVNELQVATEIVALSNGVLALTDTNNHRLRLLVRVPSLPNPQPVTTVSAASYSPTAVASESIVSAFGPSLAVVTRFATSLPLPSTLAGSTVKVKDRNNVERPAQIFFASQLQLNYLIPADTAPGTATVTIVSADGRVSVGNVDIAVVAPSFFTANSNGQGVPSAVIQRLHNNVVTVESLSEYNPQLQQVVATPIDLQPDTDQVFIALFGTGIRGNSGLQHAFATIGGVDAQVLYAGRQPDFIGLDQVNLRVPPALAGINREVDLVLSVDGKKTNTVRIFIK